MKVRVEAPVLAAVFLDLLGFGMIIADFQLRAETLVPQGWSAGAAIGALLASTFITQTLVSPHWGRYSDRTGRKPVLLICSLLSALAMLMYGFAGSLAALFVSRLLAGFGGANVAIAQALLADHYEGPPRTVALGRMSAALSFGLFIGPALGGWLAEAHGSRALGFTAAAASGLGLLLLTILPNEPPKERTQTSRKSLHFALLREIPRLRPLVLIAVVAWFSLATLEGTFARLIRQMLGYGQMEFGLIFSYESVLGFVVQGVLLGWAVKKFRETRLLRSAYVCQGIGLALNPLAAMLVPIAPGLATLFLASTLFGVGASLANPTVNSLCSRLTPEERQGELFGLLQGARSVGFVVGPILGGLLFDWKPAAPYLLAGVVCLAAALLVPSNLDSQERAEAP